MGLLRASPAHLHPNPLHCHKSQEIISAFNSSLCVVQNAPRFIEPISSSPSIRNFTLQFSVLLLTMNSKAFACIKDCPLSSFAPRAQILPFRTSGSKGLDFH